MKDLKQVIKFILTLGYSDGHNVLSEMKELKLVIKILLTLSLGFALILVFAVVSILENRKQRKYDKEKFNALLDSSNYYFIGEVECYKYRQKGEGILKLRLIESNPDHKRLYYFGKLVSISDTYILHPGTVYFYSKDTKRDQLKIGDVIKYNFNGSKKYRAYREGRLILETSPVLSNPFLEKELLKLENSQCPFE